MVYRALLLLLLFSPCLMAGTRVFRIGLVTPADQSEANQILVANGLQGFQFGMQIHGKAKDPHFDSVKFWLSNINATPEQFAKMQRLLSHLNVTWHDAGHERAPNRMKNFLDSRNEASTADMIAEKERIVIMREMRKKGGFTKSDLDSVKTLRKSNIPR